MNDLMIEMGLAMVVIPIVALLVLLVSVLMYVAGESVIEMCRNRSVVKLCVLVIGLLVAIGAALVGIGGM